MPSVFGRITANLVNVVSSSLDLFRSFEISPGVGGFNGGEPLLMRLLRSALLASSLPSSGA